MDSRIAQHMHMSACKYKQLRDYMRERVSADGSVRATVASNRHTAGCVHSHTPTFVMWVLWWSLVPGGITSATPLQHPQCAGVRPHQAGGRYSMWHCEGQGFTEHICWWNKHRGERKIPGPKPRGFTPHSPALSTFFKSTGTKPPNSACMCQTPVSQPKRTSQEGKCLLIHCSPAQPLSFSCFKSTLDMNSSSEGVLSRTVSLTNFIAEVSFR